MLLAIIILLQESSGLRPPTDTRAALHTSLLQILQVKIGHLIHQPWYLNRRRSYPFVFSTLPYGSTQPSGQRLLNFLSVLFYYVLS